MADGIHEVKIEQDRGHWIVHIGLFNKASIDLLISQFDNGDFFCSADTYNEAIKELRKTFG